MDEIDDRWRRCRGRYDRLKWARKHAGFDTAKSFAETMGIKEGTYRTYEREPGGEQKATEIDDQLAARFAKKLKVRWEWLLNGTGEPYTDERRELIRRGADDLADDDAERVAGIIASLLKAG